MDYLTQSDQNANFETISVDDKPEKILRILYHSLRNVRKNIQQIDTSQKKLILVASQMKRTSYLSELELKYCYLLRCKAMPAGVGSPFYILLCEYIDLFYDKSDVVQDLLPYMKLFNDKDDVETIRKRLFDRVNQVENMEGEKESSNEVGNHLKDQYDGARAVISLKVLRWRFVQHKVNRVLGVYSKMGND